MEIKAKLNQYKGHIIFAGLLIAALCLLDWLPKTLLVLDEKMAKYVYYVVVALALYVYYEFHWSGRQYGLKSGIKRSVSPRNLSSPSYLKKLSGQRGEVTPKRPPISQPTGDYNRAPSQSIFEKFKKE